MPLALTEDHRELAASVDGLLTRRDALGGNRALLETESETLPEWWAEVAGLGWLGLHLPEAVGGAGYGLEELAIVVEGAGRHLAPGPLVPTTIVSAALALADVPAELRSQVDQLLSGLADGSIVGGFGPGGSLTVDAGRATGEAGVVLSGGLAQVIAVPSGDDLLLVSVGDGVAVQVPPNIDPARRSARVRLDGAEVTVLPGQAVVLRDLARLVLSAEWIGVAERCTEESAAYAKLREQFGRTIGTFQAVKHHAANMACATELAVSAVWDAARIASGSPDQRAFASAAAAALAAEAADLCTNLNTQLHGGIAITWEHNAHLFVRRAVALQALLNAEQAAEDLATLAGSGVTRAGGIELPAEADQYRDEVRALIERLRGQDEKGQLETFIETGYVMPHWPRPFGRAANAIEQIVIQQELATAGIPRPNYSITGWVLLTLIQHGTQDQIDRWILPGLRREFIWCQLFSEPAAGSDAAAVRTKATRADGGWLINGQKVWTTGAQVAGFGLATVRTDSEGSKHQGITMVVIDMHAPGVTVRPLRQTSGGSEFNEVFFDDVFVPDTDVVGPVGQGWAVARATLGNESVSIGGDQDAMSFPSGMLVEAVAEHPERVPGGMARAGGYVALAQALRLLNLRSAYRAVAGGEAGPEGAISKLMLSELGHEAAAILTAAAGADGVFLDGVGGMAGRMQLMHRAISIAGGTSEIKRNQIAERILGLPRDPLIN